jgi:hypothetical protein
MASIVVAKPMRLLAPLLVLLVASAHAAEPRVVTKAVQQGEPVVSKPAPASVTAPVRTERKPLDLRVGDVRKYMTPEEFRALLDSREFERNTIVVQAEAPLLPMKTELDVPGGLFAPFWALAHPTQAWRIFLPDARVNIKDIPPNEVKVPPPFAAGVPNF